MASRIMAYLFFVQDADLKAVHDAWWSGSLTISDDCVKELNERIERSGKKIDALQQSPWRMRWCKVVAKILRRSPAWHRLQPLRKRTDIIDRTVQWAPGVQIICHFKIEEDGTLRLVGHTVQGDKGGLMRFQVRPIVVLGGNMEFDLGACGPLQKYRCHPLGEVPHQIRFKENGDQAPEGEGEIDQVLEQVRNTQKLTPEQHKILRKSMKFDRKQIGLAAQSAHQANESIQSAVDLLPGSQATEGEAQGGAGKVAG